MGRLVNSIGVRPYGLNRWVTRGNWKKNIDTGYIDLKLFIESFFNSKKIQTFGFQLNKLKIEESKNKIVYTVSLINVAASALDDIKLIKGDDPVFVNKTIEMKPVILKLLLIEKLLLINLNKIVKKNHSICFEFSGLENASAYLISNYIRAKLKQKYSLGNILHPLARFLKESISGSKNSLVGFKIDCKGRFTRRQRASFLTLKEGRLPFSSRNMFIDYASDSVILKYGKCGLKVWLFFEKEKEKSDFIHFSKIER